ncbi:MAG: O-methyltransferase [Ardenticatenaceae bacterium]|nr:O-methyltransferase [Ardenticatenaceae bacterium]
MMSLDQTKLRDYLDGLVPERPSEIQKMEAYAQEHDFPIIGPASGYLCYQLARMIGAKQVFELGSGYGYSIAWFAQAVQENLALRGAEGGGGAVHHTVWDEGLSQMARSHLAALGYASLIRYHVSEAVTALRQTEGPFDIIFNDIDKAGYPASLPVIEEKLRSGGLLIIDNMIWSGRVWDNSDQSPETIGVRTFTQQITTSPHWIASLIPIRDGLIVAYKK